MEEKIISLKKTAKVTGVLYLAFFITSLYAHMYVPSQLLVRGDATATTNNILNHEFLFRTCIVVSLAEVLLLIFVAFNLSRLFKQVNNQLTKLMVALAGVQVPVAFVLAAFKITALMIAKGEIADSLLPTQVPDVTMLFLKMNEYGMMVLQLLWGLWLFPFAILVYKSRFIPRILGVVLLLSGSGYIVAGVTYLLLPAFYTQIQMLSYVSVSGGVLMMIWLLVKGVKEHIIIDVESEKITKKPAPVMAPLKAY